ncbi:hypothetical protein HNR42_003337 [Deinobacterium chartae]|uniref:Uncharacterized protein n=1 Tax=Deinobacterium chartae TaxID=521158 RepID=A0A841I2H2_9DEIO|nr:hypothetical protein [Deinobacterium chartae]MBB6099877.1 hypothetical protein [Deinobacterium chartae]
MLFFEGTNPAEEKQPGLELATFRIRVGHVIFVNVGDTRIDGKITGVYTSPPSPARNTLEIAAQYLSTGNAAAAVEGRVEIRGGNGDVVATMPIDRKVALPGATTLFVGSLGSALPKGDYSALIILNYGDKQRDVVGEVTFRLEQDLAPGPSAATPGS